MNLHGRTLLVIGCLVLATACAGNAQSGDTASGGDGTDEGSTVGGGDTATGTAATTAGATTSTTGAVGATTSTTGATTGAGGVGSTTSGATTSGSTTGGSTTTTGGATSWYKPNPSNTWIWDLDNDFTSTTVTRSPYVSSYSADVYDIDPDNVKAAGITTLHNAGKKVVCYVDVGSWEPGRTDAANFDASCICGPGSALKSNGQCAGNSHEMDGWTEWWFDLHDASCVTSTLSGMQKRLQTAASLGCDAIEPDNLDEWQNNDAAGKAGGGWGTTIADQNTYVTSIAAIAHALGMGIILKNANGLLVDDNGKATAYQASIVAAFDGSLNEQCHQYSECDTYQAFGNAGKSMWNAEYLNSNSTSSCASTAYKAASCGTPGMKTLQYSCLAVEADFLAYVCP